MKVQKVMRMTGEVVETRDVNANMNEIAGKPFLSVYGDVRPRKTEGYELIEKELGCGLKAYIRFEVDDSFMSKIENGVHGMFVVNKKNIGFTGMKEEELWQAAIENMKEWGVDLKSMGQFFAELMGVGHDVDAIKRVYVARLNAHGGEYGAGILGMPCLLENIRERIGDYLILPSSVHEIICIPKELAGDVEELKGMVSFVNEYELAPEDKLADEVYAFDSLGLHMA